MWCQVSHLNTREKHPASRGGDTLRTNNNDNNNSHMFRIAAGSLNCLPLQGDVSHCPLTFERLSDIESGVIDTSTRTDLGRNRKALSRQLSLPSRLPVLRMTPWMLSGKEHIVSNYSSCLELFQLFGACWRPPEWLRSSTYVPCRRRVVMPGFTSVYDLVFGGCFSVASPEGWYIPDNTVE